MAPKVDAGDVPGVGKVTTRVSGARRRRGELLRAIFGEEGPGGPGHLLRCPTAESGGKVIEPSGVLPGGLYELPPG